MALTTDQRTEEQALLGGAQNGSQSDFPPPYLGRTARIVGPVQNVDTNDLPHPKNERGELGKALFNWWHNSISKDPLGRVSFPVHAADRRNVLTAVVGRTAKGKTNPNRTAVPDPAIMTRHFKAAARYLGADAIGIARSHPAFLYAGQRYVEHANATETDADATPEELCRKYPYTIVAPVAWDYEMGQAHRHHIGDAAYHFSQQKAHLLLNNLEAYIRELGYTAIRGAANPLAIAQAGGVGEIGRLGLIITEKYGARVHLLDAIMTDLPLVADAPIDIGVEDFCKTCRKCATTCPTNSITFEDKAVVNGVEKYKINWATCYRLRPFMLDHWSICLTCVTVCPYTKPNVWWRDLAIWALKTCPVPLRQLVVRPMKWLDDRIWGTIPQKRVRWLGYDSGIKPGEQACTVAGCTARHGDGGHKSTIPVGDIGYYAPLKENTNRFVKRG